ncbi:MFS transporter [Novosphingobium decolorationis]|uniref:MFS transporter n=1 Tax=Novosphingobium decolorationis TaxID=2698673 RepID=A0ABX8E4R7_9SPHN|nr:MFS transporter [Novosphingobium decolorationis]QVM83918.1 MFS transporter [Novosphingobium decolorationis]
MTQTRRAATQPSTVALITFALAAFGPGLLQMPMMAYVSQLYAKEFGIDLAALGGVLVTLRVFDAVTDQLMGYVSDRTRTRWGARKPWIVAGGLLCLIASFFLLRPSGPVGLVYLVAWKALYDFGFTMIDINQQSWGAELTTEYKARSKITGAKAIVTQLGSLGNYVLPIAVAWFGLSESSAYSIDMLAYFFVAAAVIFPVTIGISFFFAPKGIALPAKRPELIGFLKSVRSNKPLWIYLASFTLCGMGMGILQIIFTFYDGYLKLGAWYPYLMTVFAITMAASMPLWIWAAGRFGKHKSYVVAVTISSLAMQGYWFVDVATMSLDTILAISFVVIVFIGAGASAIVVISPAILADVADYGRLRTGEQRTGGYFAFYLLTNKVALAIGAGAAFLLLSLFGYDARADATNDATAAFGMLFTVALLPAILKIGGALIIWRFPIDQRRHAVIQRRIVQLETRQLEARMPLAPA